jgi:tetratricopeptide (TPR) repeat protein
MDVVQNKKDKALSLANKAVELDSKSSTAGVALSYAQQANFDIQGALRSLQEAVKLDPENALALARLAELFLSVGDLDKAVDSAKEAVALNPNLARTQTVLGYAYLTRIKIKEAKSAFKKAIELDSAAPLARLGLGLAIIRQGDLEAGRAEIEIASGLDPNNSLVRSYLGKAYYDEKQDKLARDQFAVAKELDPLDPTPWFYDAIRKQTTNRPVEALQDMQKSIELNDNRAVYRSRLLLDEDLAARSASLGRIYNDLGFQQLGLVEGWKSVNTAPANYSAHRMLADLYAALPRHEIARTSELFQSQLLQPLNITPVQPQLAVSNLFILEGAGPADPSFNEFNPIFLRNRLALQASGVVGNNETWGDDIAQSGVWNNFSYSLGQFHYETDGFRDNNNQNLDLYNAFVQVSFTPKTSILGEYRYSDVKKGDLELTFTNSFIPTLEQEEIVRELKLGLRHAFTPNSELLTSFIYQNADLSADVIPDFFELDSDIDYYIGEMSYLFRSMRWNITGGFGHRHLDGTEEDLGFPTEDFDIQFTNVYAYAQIDLSKNFSLTVGASADFLDGATDDQDRDKFNPKLGLIWNPVPTTTLRAAAFRTLQRPRISEDNIDPSLEPTQVAGFNQFFLDAEGDSVWRYGIAVDQKFPHNVYVGAELSHRDLSATIIEDLGPTIEVKRRDWDEWQARGYLNWTPHPWLALSADYLFEYFDRDAPDNFAGVEAFTELKTHRVPLGARFFHPSGFSAGLKATFVYQDGDFIVEDFLGPTIEEGDDQFWVVDASISYRLPKRYGLISLEAKNLFDNEFHFQDTDPGNPRISPERFILLKATLAF